MMGSKIGYYLLVLPLSLLPLRVIYLITDIFFVLLISVIPYRKKVILTNLSNSFPDKSEKEIRRLTRKFYKHFTDILAEGIKNLTISKHQLRKRFSVKNPELMAEQFNAQKSVLLVSGHYNNWEWLITSQNFLFQHQALGIGMPLTSKFWDKKINERRERFGMKVVNAKNFRQHIKASAVPVAILILSDQSPADARKSYWMNFLGQDTAVLFGTEQLAHEYGFNVVFFHIKKIKRGYYELELKLITDQPKIKKWGEITEAHTHLLEQIIREKPEYWIWSHKRWKREKPVNFDYLLKEQHEKFNQKYK